MTMMMNMMMMPAGTSPPGDQMKVNIMSIFFPDECPSRLARTSSLEKAQLLADQLPSCCRDLVESAGPKPFFPKTWQSPHSTR